MLTQIIDALVDLGPRVGWVLGVELLRGLAVLLVVAVAIRAAGGVRARYRIVGAGIVLALLLPLAGVTPGGWRIGVPGEWVAGMTNQPSAAEEFAVIQGRALAPALTERGIDLQPWLGTERSLSEEPLASVALVAEPAMGEAAETIPILTGSSASSGGFEFMGWSVADVRALGDQAMAGIESAAGEPITWVGLWAFGALAVLAWGFLGVLRLALIARDATPADDRWTLEADRVTKRLGIRRAVRVVVSDRVPVPMTWGVFRPIVVVPVMASEWNAERRRVVLTHELVHVQRLDWALQIAAWCVAALHWCNPLAWWAVRRLAVERERSCDAAVVASGTRPSAYASHLLDIARAMSDVRSPVHALGMAKASELEGRLMSILNGSRRGAKRSVAAAMLVMCAGLAAAAVAPEIVPPEKQAELDRYEAELAELEAKLMVKRARLEEAREAAEADEDAEEIVEAEARSRYKELAAREGEHRVRAEHLRRAEREQRAHREVRDGHEVREGREIVVGRELRGDARNHQSEVYRQWREIAKDKGALYEKLSNYQLRYDPRMAELHEHLKALGGELEIHGGELGKIAEKLIPFQQAIEGRTLELEPLHLNLQELQETLELEMAPLHLKLQEMIESPEMQVRIDRARVSADKIQVEVEAMAEQITEAVKNGDFERVQVIGAKMAELADHSQHVQQVTADEVHAVQLRTMKIADRIRLQQDKIQGRIHERMEGVHEQMEHVQEGMSFMHQGMDEVHGEMDGIHQEMEVVHGRMEKVHHNIEQVIRDIVRDIVREALEEHGISVDNSKGEKLISAASRVIGGRTMQLTTRDDTELVRITDKVEQFKRMREAVSRAEAAGEFKLDQSVLDRLDEALQDAAEGSEVLRFKLRHADDSEI